MASKKTLTAQFEALPQIAKIIILVLGGWLVGGIFRLIRYTETKNTATLIVGILGIATGVGNIILEIVDIVTTVLNNKITFYAD